MKTLVLLLGGNEDNSMELFSQAEKLLAVDFGDIINQSSLFESQPWGIETQNWFLNKIICFRVDLLPHEIIDHCLYIETFLGRKRNTQSKGYESRNIDIDILFLGNDIIDEKDLIVPHPRLHLRKFTLCPLHEIMPDFIHPIIGLSMTQLLQQCTDDGLVRKL